MILRCFLSAGEVAGGNSKDTSFYCCIQVHSRFRELHLKTPFSNFLCLLSPPQSVDADFRSHLDALSRASARRFSVISLPQSIISSFHRAFELSGLNPGVMRRFCLAALRLSVVFIQLNDASQALSALQAEDRITAIFFFFSDLPPSLLVIQHLLYHTNNSIITVQRQSRRERQAAPNGLLSPMLLCVMGNAALVGCSMYTLSSPVVKTELTLCEADVRIMM